MTERHHRPVDLVQTDWDRHPAAPKPTIAEQFWRNEWSKAKDMQIVLFTIGLLLGCVIGGWVGYTLAVYSATR